MAKLLYRLVSGYEHALRFNFRLCRRIVKIFNMLLQERNATDRSTARPGSYYDNHCCFVFQDGVHECIQNIKLVCQSDTPCTGLARSGKI